MQFRNLFGTMLLAAVLALGLGAGASQAAATATGGSFRAANQWFRAYAQAWINLDARAATQMFTEDAVYRDEPFAPPLRGEKQIRQYWDEVAHGQRDVKVGFQILSVEHNKSLILWRAAFTRVASGQKVQLAGIAEVTLNKDGKCTLFREWWNRKQS